MNLCSSTAHVYWKHDSTDLYEHARLTHMHTALRVQVVRRDVLIKDRFALIAPAPGRELVPHGPVHGIVQHVQARECDETTRDLRQRFGKLEAWQTGARHLPWLMVPVPDRMGMRSLG